MRAIRAWLLRVGGLFHRACRERELSEELESHLQMHIEDNLRRGVNPQEGRRQALVKLGGVGQTEERYRKTRGGPGVENLLQDLRFFAPLLRQKPPFTAGTPLFIAP